MKTISLTGTRRGAAPFFSTTTTSVGLTLVTVPVTAGPETILIASIPQLVDAAKTNPAANAA